MKHYALILALVYCLLVGGCVSDRMIENAEFVPAESVENTDVEKWESERLWREVLPRAKENVGDLAPSSTLGDWEIFNFETYFYGRNVKAAHKEFLTSDLLVDGEKLVFKGGSAFCWEPRNWVMTAPGTSVTLNGDKFQSDGKVKILMLKKEMAQ